MANEPDNLALIRLREIRKTLAEHAAFMKERFDQIDKGFEDFHALTNHTLRLATSSSLKSQEFGEGEQQRLRGRVDDLESRVSEIEKKLDS